MKQNTKIKKEEYHEFIREYNDTETNQILKEILQDKTIISISAKLFSPLIHKFSPYISEKIVSSYLMRKAKGIHTINDCQTKISLFYLKKILQISTRGISSSNIENLMQNNGCLLVSNHRDIIFDSTAVQYLLFLHQKKISKKTYSIAGDNLLFNECAEKILKLNRVTPFKREINNYKGMLMMLNILSEYIKDKIEQKDIVWIAQSKGRSKDSSDITSDTIIKMLYLAYKKKYSLQESVKLMNIIPVCISYEYDPCDMLKAIELYEQAENLKHKKEKNEDINSVEKGLMGYKGKIHLHFGEQIKDNVSSIEDLSKLITKSIHSSYKIFSSNLTAYSIRSQNDPKKEQNFSIEYLRKLFRIPKQLFPDKRFMKKYDNTEDKLKKFLLLNYSNPVYSKIKHLTN